MSRLRRVVVCVGGGYRVDSKTCSYVSFRHRHKQGIYGFELYDKWCQVWLTPITSSTPCHNWFANWFVNWFANWFVYWFAYWFANWFANQVGLLGYCPVFFSLLRYFQCKNFFIQQELQPQFSCQAAAHIPYLAIRTGTLSAIMYLVLA